MNQPAIMSPAASAVPQSTRRSWFRTAAGRLYFSRLAAIIVFKLVLLTLLYYAVLKPAVRPDASAAAIQQRWLDAPAAATGPTSP